MADLLKPYGPLVGLGVGDPATVLTLLRKTGVGRIVVAPTDDGGWSFKGTGDFARATAQTGVNRSPTPPFPPTPPTGLARRPHLGSVAPAKPAPESGDPDALLQRVEAVREAEGDRAEAGADGEGAPRAVEAERQRHRIGHRRPQQRHPCDHPEAED